MSANAATKNAYAKPKLIVYGDIRQLTEATGSTSKKADGGKGVNNKT